MVTVFVFKDGTAREVPALDPLWLAPGATEVFWVDLETPNEEERKLLTDTFHFHELASKTRSRKPIIRRSSSTAGCCT
jgi:Mg2+ and Co2+ transporter CorA